MTVISYICISYLKTALELEDAEQAYYSQWWRLGYDDQPPFYTWLQKIFIMLFGVSKLSFALLRGTLFAAVLLALANFTKRLGIAPHKQSVFLFFVTLMPVFVDLAFRRLSHTVLMSLMVVLSLIVLDKLIKKRNYLNYVLLGLCLGFGLLSKYNYALFLVALLSLVFFDIAIRKAFLDRRITITILICVLLNIPHLFWLFSETNLLEIELSLTEKISKKSSDIPFVSALFTILKAYFKLILPLLIVMSILFVTKRARINKKVIKEWFFKLFLLQTALIFLMTIFFDVQKVEVRWLLPIYLPYIILLLKYTDFRVTTFWSRCGIIIYTLIVFLQTIRTPFEKLFHIPSSVHNDYSLIVDKIDQNATRGCLVILPDVTYAGQVIFLRPNKRVVFNGDYSIPKDELGAKNYLVIRKNAIRPINPHILLKDSIIGFGKDRDTLLFYSIQGTKKLSFHSLSSLLNATRK